MSLDMKGGPEFCLNSYCKLLLELEFTISSLLYFNLLLIVTSATRTTLYIMIQYTRADMCLCVCKLYKCTKYVIETHFTNNVSSYCAWWTLFSFSFFKNVVQPINWFHDLLIGYSLHLGKHYFRSGFEFCFLKS